MSAATDLVIVGAGAAGLAAAHAARAHGLGFRVLEAGQRVGGRAYTESASLGVPFDHGCQWLHSASANPFAAMASQWGMGVARANALRRRFRRRLFLGGRWATEEEERACWSFIAASDAAAQAAGEQGRDVAVSDVTPRDSAWTPLFDHWIAATCGHDPDAVSTLDYARYSDTGENWPVREGYGAVIARYGEGIPVELSTPVERIVWGGREVALHTPRGALRARAALVTVSTGVLASGGIRFDPPLPDWKRAAIEALPPGPVDKIGLRLEPGALEVGEQTWATAAAGSETIGLQLRPWGWDVAVGWVAGRFAAALEREGPAAMQEFTVERLVAMFGSALRARVVGAVSTSWCRDPHFFGAYSSARPGAGEVRVALARPLDGRVFFAGEAASLDEFSTAHGAFKTGVAAVEFAARTLRPS